VYLEALKNSKQAGVRNITRYPFDIGEIQLESFFSEKFDFVFIDAQKGQYGDYIQKIQSCLYPENTLLLDDVIKYQNKLT
jgi:predicted O-methyltransferase YrrM